MLDNLKKKWLAGALVVGLVLGFWAGQRYNKWQMATNDVVLIGEETDGVGEIEPIEPPATTIAVHVAGAVEKPGVYQLHEGERVEDALVLAKVLPEGLVDEYLNRAAVLSDGEKIVVPSSANLEGEGAIAMPLPALSSGSQGQGLVNINQAELGELTALPGIGEVKAQAIIDYRNAHGRFQSIDELKNVKGIGEKTFEGLKDKISV